MIDVHGLAETFESLRAVERQLLGYEVSPSASLAARRMRSGP